MPEAEQTAAARPDEAALGERLQVRIRGRRCIGIEQRDDIRSSELLPDHGAALEHRALAGAEAVEARGEQRLDRLGQRPLREPAFQRQRQQLLEEERVALRGLGDARALIRFERRSTETLEQRIRLLRGERVEDDPVDVRAPVEERRSLLEQLLAREADDRDRPLALVREVLDELEERRLRPVNVVEHEDERPLARARLAELAEEPGELGRRRRRLGVERSRGRRRARRSAPRDPAPHVAAST